MVVTYYVVVAAIWHMINAASLPFDAKACDLRFERELQGAPRSVAVCVFGLSNVHSDWKGVGLATHGSHNRISRIKEQLIRWNGPAASAILAQDGLEYQNALRQVKDLTKYGIVGLVAWTGDPQSAYPINFMRNLAQWLLTLAKNIEASLLLDADVMVSQNSQFVTSEWQRMCSRRGHCSEVMLVIPCFEFIDPHMVNHDVKKKENVVELLNSNQIQAMHSPKPSYSFNVEAWKNSQSDIEIEYNLMSEPYGIVRLDEATEQYLYPEIFNGRGLNKQAHHFERWAAGYTFVLMDKVFLFDQPNPSFNSSKMVEKTNIQSWYVFRNEISSRYGLDCRDAFWRICDDRGLHCDKVCERSVKQSLEESNVQEKHPKRTVGRLEPRSTLEPVDGEQSSFPIDRNECLREIDFVYTWVNGSDPFHIQNMQRYIPASARDSPYKVGTKRLTNHKLSFRFRDFGANASTLRFSIQSLLRFAPWLRKIHVVIADYQEAPSFLNLDDSRVNIVRHSSIMRKDCLPTFNSCAIESAIHRINGLANCYWYLNDDVMLLQNLDMDRYWPRDRSSPLPVFNGQEAPIRSSDEWHKKLANIARILKRTMGLSSVFLSGHIGHFFVKNVVQQVIDHPQLNQEWIRTECEQWRSDHSFWLPMVYQNFIFANWNSGVLIEREIYYAMTDWDGVQGLRMALDAAQLNVAGSMWLCLNDILGAEIDTTIPELLNERLTNLFPYDEVKNRIIRA